jgi:integrase
MRRAASSVDWIFPASTKSGHVEASTLKKRHSAAVTAAKVAPFVPYDMRHTCLTRWAKVLDPFTLKKLAGHADLNTTMRYVHLNDADVRAAMEKAQGGHKSGHTPKLTVFERESEIPATDGIKRN